MLKLLLLAGITLSFNSAAGSQSYFLCSIPVTGPYAFENQEFGVMIELDSVSMTILTGSSDSIFPGNRIRTTNVVITAGGPNGWPSVVAANYLSPDNGSPQSAAARFKVGKHGKPAVIYTSTESNVSLELQCF